MSRFTRSLRVPRPKVRSTRLRLDFVLRRRWSQQMLTEPVAEPVWHHKPSDRYRTCLAGPRFQQDHRCLRTTCYPHWISALSPSAFNLRLLHRRPSRTRYSYPPYSTTESLRMLSSSMVVHYRHGYQRSIHRSLRPGLVLLYPAHLDNRVQEDGSAQLRG